MKVYHHHHHHRDSHRQSSTRIERKWNKFNVYKVSERFGKKNVEWMSVRVVRKRKIIHSLDWDSQCKRASIAYCIVFDAHIAVLVFVVAVLFFSFYLRVCVHYLILVYFLFSFFFCLHITTKIPPTPPLSSPILPSKYTLWIYLVN